jgi:hypothetical protein
MTIRSVAGLGLTLSAAVAVSCGSSATPDPTKDPARVAAGPVTAAEAADLVQYLKSL